MNPIRFTNRNFWRFTGISIFIMMLSLPSIAQESSKPIEITVVDAIMMALKNNSAFQVQLLNPELSLSQENAQKSAFDIKIADTLSLSSGENEAGKKTSGASDDLSLTKPLTTGGSVGLGLTSGRSGGGTSGPYSSKIAISLSQSILKGAGSDVTLANLNKAKLSYKSSKYELQGFAESLVSQVENTYWDYAFAEKQLKIYEDSVALAEKQLEETNVMIEVGKLAEIERIASEAEVASRKEALINAKSDLEKSRLTLLRLVNPQGVEFWDQTVMIKDEFKMPEYEAGELKPHIETALKKRPDLNQAQFQLERNDLDVMVTKNGLLPTMDFFISLGMTGYADSFTGSIRDISSSGNDLQYGIRYNQFIGRRDAKEKYKQSKITREQGLLSLDNLEQLAEVDVATSWIEVNRTKEQIAATAATRKLQEEKLRAETEKYRVGKSTSLLVAQAQRDFLSSQIGETQAIANYQKAVVNLMKVEGTLLDHFGITYLEPEVQAAIPVSAESEKK